MRTQVRGRPVGDRAYRNETGKRGHSTFPAGLLPPPPTPAKSRMSPFPGANPGPRDARSETGPTEMHRDVRRRVGPVSSPGAGDADPWLEDARSGDRAYMALRVQTRVRGRRLTMTPGQ